MRRRAYTIAPLTPEQIHAYFLILREIREMTNGKDYPHGRTAYDLPTLESGRGCRSTPCSIFEPPGTRDLGGWSFPMTDSESKFDDKVDEWIDEWLDEGSQHR